MKKVRSHHWIGLTIIFLGLLALPITGLAAEITLKLGHIAPTGDTDFDVAARTFAKRVAANTGGKVEVKVFGNAQFGNIFEHFAQLKTGAIDLTVGSASATFLVEPPPKNLVILLSPYLFESQEHYHNYLRSDLFKSMMAKVEKASNIKYVGFIGNRAPRGFSTGKTRVETPADLKGLKMGVPPVPPFVAAYKAWGANPTPVPASEIYSALKSGLVDGRDQDKVNIWTAKYYEVQKHWVDIEYMRDGLAILMNGDKWKSLPENLKAAFQKSAGETATHINAFTDRMLKEAELGLSKAGVEVVKPDLKPWKAAVESAVPLPLLFVVKAPKSWFAISTGRASNCWPGTSRISPGW